MDDADRAQEQIEREESSRFVQAALGYRVVCCLPGYPEIARNAERPVSDWWTVYASGVETSWRVIWPGGKRQRQIPI